METISLFSLTKACCLLSKDKTQYPGPLCGSVKAKLYLPMQFSPLFMSDRLNVTPLNFNFKWNETAIPKVPSVSQTSHLQRRENQKPSRQCQCPRRPGVKVILPEVCPHRPNSHLLPPLPPPPPPSLTSCWCLCQK